MKLRTLRVTLAAVMLVGITLLFLDFTGTLHQWLSWMASLQALEAVLALNFAVISALAVITIIFGRIYCSVICPLGLFQDVVGWIGKKSKRNRYSYSDSRTLTFLRYLVLVLFVVLAVMGVGVVLELLAPYSAFGRMVTMLLQPLYIWCNNLLAQVAAHYDSYAFYSVDVWLRSLPVLVIALLTTVIIAVLAWRNGRTYCNTICPVGTALSFLARFSWMKIHFDTEKCRNCSLCSRNCKASCIDFKSHTVDYSRCVVCGDCLESCKFDALSYCHHKESEKSGTDSSRRAFLTAVSLISVSALAQEKKKVDGGLAEIEEKAAPQRQTPIVPPGALSADNMARRCTGCQLCVSKCPNGVLRPSTDWNTLMKPEMSYERGYCRPECTVCSEVCPAGAIQPISREEKTAIQIGHAVWVKSNCIPVTDGVECGNCARHCPSGAIEMVSLDPDDELSPMVPVVNENACIGCGACEYVCPARPFSAIIVEGHPVHKNV